MASGTSCAGRAYDALPGFVHLRYADPQVQGWLLLTLLAAANAELQCSLYCLCWPTMAAQAKV